MEMTLPRSKLPVYEIGYLKNVSGFAMNVNGAVTPKNFEFLPELNVWAVELLTVFVIDPGVTGPTNFGALNVLTNGLKLEVKTNGQVRTISILKDNIDLSVVFGNHPHTMPALDTVSAPIGWLNRVDFYKGVLKFDEPMVLFSEKGDYIRAVVQDDLTGLEHFRMKYTAWRQLR